MSALDNTTRHTAPAVGLRGLILASVAAGALFTLVPVAGHAQGLDRLYNRAAEVESNDTTQNTETEDAVEAVPAEDTWGLEVETTSSVPGVEAMNDEDVGESSVLTLPSLGQAPAGSAALAAMPDPVRDELERQIDTQMRAIIDRIGQETPQPDTTTLTVEELDALQRQAQRAAASQTLKDAQQQATRSEIEMLLFLQNTITELQEARADAQAAAAPPAAAETAAAAPQVDVEALRAQWEAEQAAEQVNQEQESRNAALAAEQAAIPRLAAVKGAAGVWEAEIESVRGVMQFVMPGDALADGFLLESLDGKGAVIKAAATGNRYSLIPSPPTAAAAGGDQPTSMAQDLSVNGGVF